MPRPSRTILPLLLLLPIATALRAQDPSKISDAGYRLWRASGRSELARGRPERALGHLLRARSILIASELPELDRKRELVALDAEISRLDPCRKKRVSLSKGFAPAALSLASRYQAKAWRGMALELLRDAERVQPGRFVKEIERLAKRSDPLDEVIPTFAGGEEPYQKSGSWSISDEGYQAPAISKDLSACQLSRFDLRNRVRVRLQVRIGNATQSTAGLVFAWKDKNDFWMIDLRHWEKETQLQLLQFKDGDFKVKKRLYSPLRGANRSGWIPLEIVVDGERVEWRIGAMKAQSHVEKGASFSGKLGLFVSGDSGGRDEVVFRSLRIESLLEEGEAKNERFRESERLERLGRFALEGKEKEAAARWFLAAIRISSKLARGRERVARLSSLRSLLFSCDPLSKQRIALFTRLAKSSASLATQYAKREWFETAQRYLDLSRQLDPFKLRKASKMLRQGIGRIEAAEAKQWGIDRTAIAYKTGEARIGPAKWSLEGEEIRYTPPKGGVPLGGKKAGEGIHALFLTRATNGALLEAAVEIRNPEVWGSSGFVLGYGGEGASLLVRVRHLRRGRSRVRVREISGKESRDLLSKSLRFPGDELASWIPLRITLEAEKIVLLAGKEQRFEFPRPPKAYAGRIGFFVGNDVEDPSPLSFRKFRYRDR